MIKKSLTSVIRAYQLLFSGWLGQSCRFTPSCSGYAMDAIARHGALAGSYLACRRIARCNPWCEAGHDPVPDQAPTLFTHLSVSSSTHKRSS